MNNNNISQALEAQKLSEEYLSEQIAGAGATPSYITTEEIKAPEIEPTISVDISGIRSSLSSAQTRKLEDKPPVKTAEETPNYILNKPLQEILSRVRNYFDPDIYALEAEETETTETGGTYGTQSSALTSETSETGQTGDQSDTDWDVSATYTVSMVVDKDGNVTVTVTDPDGEEHTFDSLEEAEEYLKNESEKYDGCIIVDYEKTEKRRGPNGSTYTVNSSWSDIYKDGEKVASFDDRGVLDSHEKAEQWLQNQRYENADTSYIYDYSSLDGIDGNSSDGDVANALDDELDRALDGFDDSDFIWYDEDGWMQVDGERLEAWYRKIRFLCALLVALQMLMKAKHEARNLVQQEMLGIVTHKGMDTATIIAKYVQNRLARVSMAFAKLLQKAQEHNDELYKRLENAAKKKNDGCGEKTWDVISGGENTKKVLRALRNAADRYLKATTALLETMRRASASQGEFELGDSDTAKINEALQREEMMIIAELPLMVVDGENGYLELDSDKLSSLRKRFHGIKNIKKAWNTINNSKAEARNLVHEEMTGVGGREKNKNAEKLQDMEGMHATLLFETQVNLLQQKISLFNNKRYLQNQLHKLGGWTQALNIISNIVMVAAIVVSFIYWPAGLALTGLAQLLKLGASINAYNKAKLYKPPKPSHKPVERDTDTGNAVLDTLNASDNYEDQILAQIDDRFLENEDQDTAWYEDIFLGDWMGSMNVGSWFAPKGDDPFQQVNFKALAGLRKQLEGLHNIKRAIKALYKERASLRNLVHMEMTGIGGRETSEYVDAAFEADFLQAQFKFDMLTFMLNELKNAINIEIDNDRQLMTAINTFVITGAVAAITACLGAAIGGALDGVEKAAEVAQAAAEGASTAAQGFSIGFGIGSALGGFLASYLNEGPWGSAGVSYGDSDLPPYLLAIKNNNPNSTGARLEALELQILEDLLMNGIDKNVGEGYWGLKGDYLAKLRMQLGRIANIKNALTSLHSDRADTRNLVHLEMTGISGRKHGELTGEVNKANLEANLKTFDLLTRYLDQRIEAQQRHVNASKALKDARNKFWIDLAVVAVLGTAGGLAGSATLINIIPASMALANSVYNFILSLIRMNSGMGRLENYDAAQVAIQLKNQNNPNSTMNRLDQLEMEAYMQISQGLIEEMGAGRWGINTGVAALMRHKMGKIYNIRDAIARLQAAEAEVRAALHSIMTGVGGRVSGAGAAFGAERTVALANVASLLRVVQTIVQRHNQINAYSRQMWQSVVQAGFAALSLAFAVISAENSQEDLELSKKENSIKEVLYGTKENKLDGLEAQKAALQIKVNANPTDKGLKGELAKIKAQIKPKVKKFNRLRGERIDLKDSAKQLALYQFITGMSEVLLTILTGVIYDSAKGEQKSKESDYKSRVNQNSSGSGWAASVERSETDAVQSALSAGATELDTGAMAIHMQQVEELLNGFWNMIKGSANYIKSSRSPDLVKNYLEMERDNIEKQTAIAAKKMAEAEKKEAKSRDILNEYRKECAEEFNRLSVQAQKNPNQRLDTSRLDSKLEKLFMPAMDGWIDAVDDYLRSEEEFKNLQAAAALQGNKAAPDQSSFVSESKHIQNVKVLMERLEQIMERMQKDIQQVEVSSKKAIEKSDEVISLAKQAAIKDAEKLDLKELLREAEDRLKQARKASSDAVEARNKADVELSAAKKQTALYNKEIDKAIASLDKALKKLGAIDNPDSETIAKIKGLQKDIERLRFEKEAQKRKIKEKEEGVKSAKGKGDEAKGKVQVAAKQVNQIIAKIEAQSKKTKAKNTGNLVPKADPNKVSQVNNNLRENRRKSPYELYLEEQKRLEESVRLSGSARTMNAVG